jgi:cell fate regulator YaaT (PSP1 superfamily)
MEYIYIIDRLTSKVIKCPLKEGSEAPKYGTKVLYKDEEQKSHTGTVLGYPRECRNNSIYVGPLSEAQVEQFNKNQERAKEMFPNFKIKFKEAFPESVPVTARMNLYGNEIYFYFFAEVRFNFADFVRSMRPEIPMNFFLYQVGARDRIRLDPRADGMVCSSGHGTGLDCKTFHHPLPNIETEHIIAQQLEGRDIEKLKGLCGKLKCSLAYEQDRYVSASRKFPQRGRIFDYLKEKVKCIGVNLVTEEIKLRKEE